MNEAETRAEHAEPAGRFQAAPTWSAVDSDRSIDTWEALKNFGFQPESSVITGMLPGLGLDFGNIRLSAICCGGKWFEDVVLFTGIMKSPSSIGMVRFEMPRQVRSRNICAAWIVWHLDRAADRVFVPAFPESLPFLELGRLHTNLLPWEQARVEREAKAEAYNQRPHCSVQREWLKLAHRRLATILAEATDEEQVLVEFDGRVLSFVCRQESVITAATGTPWPLGYELPVGRLRKLPKRLLNDPVDVSIWEGRLQIDRHRFVGIVECPLDLVQGDKP